MKTILVDAVDAFVIEGEGVYKPMHDLPYELFTLKHNPDKTDPKYFALMLKHFDLKPEDVVYFEHNWWA